MVLRVGLAWASLLVRIATLVPAVPCFSWLTWHVWRKRRGTAPNRGKNLEFLVFVTLSVTWGRPLPLAFVFILKVSFVFFLFVNEFRLDGCCEPREVGVVGSRSVLSCTDAPATAPCQFWSAF